MLSDDSDVLYLPLDDDGIVQNNFIAGPPFHPLLLWLLRVRTACARWACIVGTVH
jgi:hypothetical protein